jgi:hypothetical protein
VVALPLLVLLAVAAAGCGGVTAVARPRIPAVIHRIKDCNVDPATHHCLLPYHDTSQIDVGGPHQVGNAPADINGGRMNGFVKQVRNAITGPCRRNPTVPSCVIDSTRPDVMGYHTAAEIPNYWRYAHHYVLQDHMYLDAYLKFIEDDFVGGARIDPATDGRPDSRPSVRENASQLGNLLSEFDFSRPPQKPLLLPPTPSLDCRCATAPH